MKDNLTEIVCILDMSGSMESLTTDTIGGYNSFIEQQKELPGEAFVTTVLFNDNYYLLKNHEDVRKASPLSAYQYRPIGCTALMDAIGKTINDVGARLNDTPEEERPSHVVFMITTDGMENASREFTKESVKKMVEHQQQKYSWEFLFIGAGIDAYDEAESIGINNLHTMYVAADSVGTQTLYNSVSFATSSIRSAGSITSTAWKGGQTKDDVN